MQFIHPSIYLSTISHSRLFTINNRNEIIYIIIENKSCGNKINKENIINITYIIHLNNLNI